VSAPEIPQMSGASRRGLHARRHRPWRAVIRIGAPHRCLHQRDKTQYTCIFLISEKKSTFILFFALARNSEKQNMKE
jgi:hypothetical protein